MNGNDLVVLWMLGSMMAFLCQIGFNERLTLLRSFVLPLLLGLFLPAGCLFLYNFGHHVQ